MSPPPLIGISSNLFPAADRRFYKGKSLEYGEQALAGCLARAGAVPVMLYRGGSPATVLEDAAADGKSVSIEWRYRSTDNSMKEAGEDFEEDMEEAEYRLVEIA